MFALSRVSLCAVLVALVCISRAAISEEATNDSKENIGILTVADYFDFESVSDPRVSPDGRHVVFTRTWTDIHSDRRYTNLWIVDFDGDDLRPLTTGKRSDRSPRWSPSGDRIAYLSSSDGATQLHVRWMDSGQTARVTNVTKSPSNLSWSPDGKWLAFNALVPGKKPDGPKMPAKPEGAQWAPEASIVDRLIYRTNNDGYKPRGFAHIFVVPADGGTARRLTDGDYDHGAPAWSAASDAIFFSAIRKPDAEWVVGDTEIYRLSILDGGIAPVTDRYGPDNAPVVSPDGNTIAYTGFDEKRQSYTVTKLHVMNADGSDARLVSDEFDDDVRSLRWRNDGRRILFTAGQKGARHLHSATVGGRISQVTHGEFQVGSYHVGPNGRVASVITSAQEPGDIYTFTLANPNPKRITRVNEDVLAHRDLGELEEIWYESSFDGRDIQGWLLTPPGFDPLKKYPLVLYIHGGPHGMYGVNFSFEFQTIAAQGYLVLYTNPRGSTGYGEEFGNIIQHNYPGDDFFDLESGVDAILERGYVDEDRLYVTGGSGGGVLTCWVVGRSQRYRAAVSQFPVINWYSFVTTADFGHTMGWRWFEKWPWEDPESYDKRSPISLVGNVTTPLLLITGENDWRTPISETEQYYAALKIQKKEAVMVRVPGEAHGIAARPSHYIAKMLFVREWFDKHGGEVEQE